MQYNTVRVIYAYVLRAVYTITATNVALVLPYDAVLHNYCDINYSYISLLD